MKVLIALVVSLFVLSSAVITLTVPYRNGQVVRGKNSWYVAAGGAHQQTTNGVQKCVMAAAMTSDFETFHPTEGPYCSNPNVLFKGKLIGCGYRTGCGWSIDGLTWSTFPNTTALGLPSIYAIQGNERGIMAILQDTYTSPRELGWITDVTATSWEIITPHPKLNMSFSFELQTAFGFITIIQTDSPNSISIGGPVNDFWYNDIANSWRYQRKPQIVAPVMFPYFESQCGDNCYVSIDGSGLFPNGLKVSHDLLNWTTIPLPKDVIPTGVCCRGTTCLTSSAGGILYQFDINNPSNLKVVLAIGSPSTFATCDPGEALLLTIGGRLLIEIPSIIIFRKESDPFVGTTISGLVSARDEEGNTKATVLSQVVQLTPPYLTTVAFQRDEFSQWKRVNMSTLRIWESFVNCDLLPDYIRQSQLGACYYSFENGNSLKFKHLQWSALLTLPVPSQLRLLTVVDGIFHFIGNSTFKNTLFFILPTHLGPADNVLTLEHSSEEFSATYACSNGSVAFVGGVNRTSANEEYSASVKSQYYINGTSWKEYFYYISGDTCAVVDSTFVVFDAKYGSGYYNLVTDVERFDYCSENGKYFGLAIFPEQDSLGLVGMGWDKGIYALYYNSTSHCLDGHRSRMMTPNLGAANLEFVLGENGAVLGRNGETLFQV